MLSLTDILTPERIKVPLQHWARFDAIEELVDLLAQNGDLLDRDLVLEAVFDRERSGSTGIGGSVAVPHAKTQAVRQLVMAIGMAQTPVDFKSPDGEAVSLIILVISPPNQTPLQIQAMVQIARTLGIEPPDQWLPYRKTPEDIFQAVIQRERACA